MAKKSATMRHLISAIGWRIIGGRGGILRRCLILKMSSLLDEIALAFGNKLIKR